MQFIRSSFICASIALVALVVSPAIGSSSDRIGAFDFTYESSGDARVRPVQVFDDGRSTFFQFRPGEPVPAIFVESTSGTNLVMPEMQGPYVKVPTVWNAFALRLGYGSGRVNYVGLAASGRGGTAKVAPQESNSPARVAAAGQLMGAEASEGPGARAARIALEENSYATPIKGDAVAWASSAERWQDYTFSFPKDGTRLSVAAMKQIKGLVAGAKPGARFEVVGHDDENHKEKVSDGRAAGVVAALQAAGATRTAITHRTSSEVRESTKGQYWGVALRIHEGAVRAAAADVSVDVADVLRRLRSGAITPGAAVALLDPAKNRTGAVAPSSGAPQSWAMRKSDETVERMLGRWAKEGGWKLVWQSGPSIPITGDAAVSRPDYLQAADYVIAQAKGAGYRIKATAYSNQTLVISED